jgi:hypothetical protein
MARSNLVLFPVERRRALTRFPQQSSLKREFVGFIGDIFAAKQGRPRHYSAK